MVRTDVVAEMEGRSSYSSAAAHSCIINGREINIFFMVKAIKIHECGAAGLCEWKLFMMLLCFDEARIVPLELSIICLRAGNGPSVLPVGGVSKAREKCV